MTLWELTACVEGWNRVHGSEDGKAPLVPPTEEEFEDMIERHRPIANRVIH